MSNPRCQAVQVLQYGVHCHVTLHAYSVVSVMSPSSSDMPLANISNSLHCACSWTDLEHLV